MALVNCPECDSEISDQADDCPECGYPIGNDGEDEGESAAESEQTGWGETSADETSEPTSRETDDASAYEEDDEQVLLRMHPSMFRESPFLFVLYILLPVIVLAILPARAIISGLFPPFIASLPWYVILIIAAAASLPIFFWWIDAMSRTLIITNKKTRLRRGLLSRDVNEVYHEHVRNVQINQSIIQRLTNVGEVQISSAGQSDVEITFKGVHHPKRVNEIIDDYV